MTSDKKETRYDYNPPGICANCRWQHIAEARECRRRSPDKKRLWPKVKIDDWCGEWEFNGAREIDSRGYDCL